jgi:hypothetical protein
MFQMCGVFVEFERGMIVGVANKRWFTFTIREDRLAGIAIGAPLSLLNAKGEQIEARVTASST